MLQQVHTLSSLGGFTTKICREQGHIVKPSTKAVYLPLINMNPSDPDSMLSAMVEGERLAKQCGQDITVLINDQQLYKGAVKVKWAYPKTFADFISRLGVCICLWVSLRCVGVLMVDTRLEDIMKSYFECVENMLSGNKFPQNFRALRFMTEELLRVHKEGYRSHDEMQVALESISSRSNTSRLWVQNLIKHVLIMMAFVHVKREADSIFGQ